MSELNTLIIHIGTSLQLGQAQSTGLQLGGQKPTTTTGGGLQLGQNPSLLGTQQGQAKLQPTGLTSGGLQLGQQTSTGATQGLGLQLGSATTSASTGLQLGGTSGVPTLNLQTATTSKAGQTGLQLGGLGQQKLPSSTVATQPLKTTGISLTSGISLGSSTASIGTTGLLIGKPPPSYTAPSSTGGTTTTIPATSISSSAPTGGKKYTYKQLEKMINEVSLSIT